MPNGPRLRGSSGASLGPWPIGQIPRDKIIKLGRLLTLHLAKEQTDLSGDGFSKMLSASIDGLHTGKPVGIADMALNGTAWSVKTVKAARPFKTKKVRLISGRNSPDYSFEIENPHDDIQRTGAAVLNIWNSRLDKTRSEHDDVRVMVLVRNMETKEFLLFEEELTRYAAADYEWSYTKGKNLQGRRKSDDKHCFTWQFHGGQFTVIRDIPGSRKHFRINRNIPIIPAEHVERLIQFQEDWIVIE